MRPVWLVTDYSFVLYSSSNMTKTVLAKVLILCVALGGLGGIGTFAVEYYGQGGAENRELTHYGPGF